jgi:hypothetical protein
MAFFFFLLECSCLKKILNGEKGSNRECIV